MTAGLMTLKYQRLRTPAGNAETLQVPPLNQFGDTLQSNRQILADHHFDLLGVSIYEVRETAREEMRHHEG